MRDPLFGETSRRRCKQQVHDHRDAGRNADEQPRIEQAARGQLADCQWHCPEQVERVADDESNRPAEWTQFAGRCDEENGDRDRGHADDAPHRIIDHDHGDEQDEADDHGDQRHQHKIQDKANRAVAAIEKEHDIDRQRRIRRLIDFDDQNGKGTDHRQTGCKFEPARLRRHKAHNVWKDTLTRAL